MKRLFLGLLLVAAPAAAGDPRADYAALLKRVAKAEGVDYTTLKKERAVLDRYVAALAKAAPGKTDPERIAFWINAYNALTLQHVLDNKPRDGDFSVKHDVSGFWTKRKWTVAGRRVPLDAIEHEILRKEFVEPRIHFALNCASRSCPPLLGRVYEAKTLDVILSRQTRAYLADTEQNEFDLPRRRARVSKIFDWFKGDFTKGRTGGVPGLQQFLADYAPTETLARALRKGRWRISFQRYDWGLNEAGRKHDVAPWPVHPLWLLLYLAAAIGLLLYGLHAFKLLWWRGRHRERYEEELREARESSALGRTDVPPVLVQVPIYNEPRVARRAIDAVAALDYPREALEIQVLDDSTDETGAIVDRAIARHRANGVPVRVIRRQRRRGFKAGALANGLARSGAQFVAVFDADFVPPRDFLRRALPLFDAPGRVACVQGRWAHLNRTQNWLTRAQAVGVDAHFLVLQHARAARGAFLNFSGTAGIWRRAAIDDAGGWSGDTLTEDLDLSYRAQLRGWRIVFDPELAVPAELPPTLDAFKSQQRRWACGSMQCARKYLGPVWRSRAPWWVKTEATAHLCGYFVCMSMALLIFLLPLGIWHGDVLARLPLIGPLVIALWLCGLGPLTVSVQGQRIRGRGVRLREILSCFVLGLGACVNNAVAVLRGLSRPIRTFVRTPKQGSAAAPLRAPAPVLEQVMAIFTLGTVAFLARNAPLATATYAFFFSAGFCTLAAYWWMRERRGTRV